MNATQVKGFVLAGTGQEYYRYLFTQKFKARDYPRLTMFKQLGGYHEPPPVICIGTYQKIVKFTALRKRAVLMGVEVREVV